MSEAHYLLGMQIDSQVDAQANSTKGGKPNPQPIPKKTRRPRYPWKDNTAIIYPARVKDERFKKHPVKSGLETQDNAEHPVHDSTDAEPEKRDNVKTVLEIKAVSSPRPQLLRGRTCIKLHKLKAKGYFTV